MKKGLFVTILGGVAAALLIAGCDFLLGPDAPVGAGNLVIEFGESGSRAVVPTAEEQAALRYGLVLTGPGEQRRTVSLSPGETFNEQVALGEWRIEAEAYNPENVLTGTGSATITVKAGMNEARIPMTAVPPADTPVNAFDLTGLVTAPVKGATPDTTAIDETQYTGTIAWQKTDGTRVSGNFEPSTVYQAVVTLTAKTGFTFTGLAANSFTHSGTPTVNNPADSGTVTITFPETAAPDADTVVNALGLTGLVTAPVKGATPDTTAIDETQYTGSIVWQKGDGSSVSGNFEPSTVYQAVVTLTAKTGFTFTGLAADSFTHGGTPMVNNPADSGTVTIVFPATAALTNVSGLDGNPGPNSGEVTLTWTDPADGDLGRIEITWPGGAAPVEVAKSSAGNRANSKTITGLTNGTTYIFTVKTVDTAGNKSVGQDVQAAPFVPVTGITDLPATGTVGVALTLSGTVTPANATNKTITWSVKADGTTAAGAAITNGVLSTTGTGIVKVTATIAGGLAVETNYTVDFTVSLLPPITITAEDVVYTLKGVPAGTVNVNIGDSGGPFASAGTTPVTVSAFYIGETEITYELWYAVRIWAEGNGYTFANAGREGNDGEVGEAPMTADQEPVTNISWREAVVWCNAYSEVTEKTPVYKYNNDVLRESEYYTVIAGDGKAEQAVIDPAADGFRLPTEAEWEYAARGGVPGTGAPWTHTYAGSDNEDDVAVYSTSSTAAVKSKTGGAYNGANSLGLYDMSGNVDEFCQDKYSEEFRMCRGGRYNTAASRCTVAYRTASGNYPYSWGPSTGFRVVCGQ